LIKIIICAYNEEQNLQKLLTDLTQQLELLQREFEIIFCLDGTNDNSKTIISIFSQKYKITILPESNKRGLGIAYKKAFLHVIYNCDPSDIIVSFDADFSHNPSQLKEMLGIFENKKLDFMVASRFVDKSSMILFPLYRKLISKSISIFLQNIFPIKNNNNQIKDYSSGYRIYQNEILQNLHKKIGINFITEKDFTCLIEILIKLNKNKLINNFEEFAIKYEYGNKIGASKLRLFYNFYRLTILSIKLLK